MSFFIWVAVGVIGICLIPVLAPLFVVGFSMLLMVGAVICSGISTLWKAFMWNVFHVGKKCMCTHYGTEECQLRRGHSGAHRGQWRPREDGKGDVQDVRVIWGASWSTGEIRPKR